MEIKFRKYKNSDYPEIRELLQEAGLYDKTIDSKENLKTVNKMRKTGTIVAELDNEIVGCVFIIPYGEKVAWLFRLAVKEKFQGSGIGSQIIDHAKKILKQEGVEEIGLFVNAEKQDLQEFYKKRGLRTSGKKWVYMWE